MATSLRSRDWTSLGHASLPDAEAGKNFTQQIVAGELAGNRAEFLMCQPQLFRKQVQYLIVVFGVAAGEGEVFFGGFEREHMAFAGEPGRLGAGCPAGNVEQALAQGVEVVAG